MLGLVREIRERKINSWRMDFNVHLPLVWIFLLAKVGDLAVAEAELEAYVSERTIPADVAAKLDKLVRNVAPTGR